MVFQYSTLIFLTPEPIFGAPGPHLGPGRPGVPFWAQKGGPKNITLWRDWYPTRFPQMFCEGNGFCGIQEPFGCTNFPPNPPRGRLYTDFPQTRKSQGGALGPCGGCLVPFVGPWRLGGPPWAHGNSPEPGASLESERSCYGAKARRFAASLSSLSGSTKDHQGPRSPA